MLCPYGACGARDEMLMIAVGNETIWARLCEALERPELVGSRGFSSNPDRVANRVGLRTKIEQALASDDAAAWEQRLRSEGIPAAGINDLPTALELEQTHALGILAELDHPSIEGLKTVRSPLSFDRHHVVTDRPPPLLGQDTDEVLAGSGLSQNEIAELRREGVVA